MKLLFAHAFIVLVTVVIGVTTLPSLQEISSATNSKGSKRALNDPDQASVFQISGTSLDTRTGSYVLNTNLHGEFSNLKIVKIPATEYELRELERIELVQSGIWSLKSLIVDNESVAFQTREFNDESYAFAGRFRPNTRCSASIVTAGMDGRLTKFRDGVLVATIDASFDLIFGC